METSLVILKPDAVERTLLGDIIARIERKGFKIIGMKMVQLDDAIINEHYAHLVDKPFFPRFREYMKRTPVVVMAIRGINAVSGMRNFIGATNPVEAQLGTIRGDFALTLDGNIIHASDSVENAEIELNRFFKGEGIYDYRRLVDEII